MAKNEQNTVEVRSFSFLRLELQMVVLVTKYTFTWPTTFLATDTMYLFPKTTKNTYAIMLDGPGIHI